MFKNAGQKLKGIAKSMFILTVAIGVIIALALMGMTDSPVCLIVIPVAVVIGWINTILLYAFGELCENVYHINETIQTKAYMNQPNANMKQNQSNMKQNQYNGYHC